MKVRVTPPGRSNASHVETLQVIPSWTTDDLRSTVERFAAQRLGHQAAALLTYDGRLLPAGVPLSLLGLDSEAASIDCELVTVPLIFRCEPPHGPCAGGTLVRIRGSGFLAQSGFGEGGGARVSFGALAVPCWRTADDELQCRAPPHAEGPVSVSLLGCQAARASSGCAAYEYASEGRLCDLIFATTNAHCPLRTGEEERGTGVEEQTPDWGS